MKHLLHLILLFALVGCSGGTAYAVSSLPRESITLPAAQLAPLIQGEANFSFELYRALPSEENLIFSPYSIYLAFGMV
ncbi:MAG: hypothetical protein ACK4VW_03465, partial [Anaerolineales bacterium]